MGPKANLHPHNVPDFRYTPSVMEILAQSALFLSLVSFTFGVTALSRNFFSRLFQTFTLGCLAISLWAFFFFLSFLWQSNTLYDVHLAMNAWLTPPVLLFLQYWTRTDRWKGSRILFALSILASILLTILITPGLERGSLTKQIVYFTPTLIILQVFLFMLFDRKMRTLAELPRRTLLYGGTLLVLFTSLMDHIPGLWLGISVFGNIALMAFLFLIQRDLLKQQFLHFEVYLGQFFLLILVSGVLTATYSILAVWVNGNFPLFILNAFLFSFFLVNLIPSVRRLTPYFLNSFLDERVKALRQAVTETYSETLRVIDFEGALARVRILLEVQFPVQDLTVLVFDGGKGTWGALDHGSRYLDSHPVIEAFRARGKKSPVSYPIGEELDERRRMKQSVQPDFVEFRKRVGNFLIPLVTSEKTWVGILGLHVRGKAEGMDEASVLFQRLADLLAQKQIFDLHQDRERLATLGEVAAGLAHEIRNPLGAIKGAVQLLQDAPERADDPLFRVIVEETDRLNGFLTQFLEFSKPVPVEPAWIDLRAQCEYALEVARMSCDAERAAGASDHPPIVIEWLDPAVDATRERYIVYFGKHHLTQVLLNLLRNSVRALTDRTRGDGERKITFETIVTSPGELSLRIRDTGIGIPEENLRKIFIPFYTTDPAGTGLGLSISKKLMTSYGGNILVRSRPLEWTEVELRFNPYRLRTAEERG